MSDINPGELSIIPLQSKGAFNVVSLQNEMLKVEICPEASRIISIENRRTNQDCLRRLESQLPDSSRAGGIGDGFYADHWRGGMWEYVARNKRLGGYQHSVGQEADRVWVDMRKESLQDLWTDPGYPGLGMERTVTVRRGRPTVEILDRRTNQESCLHAMMYDLIFHLVPFGGGQQESSMHLPPWARLMVLYFDGKAQVLSREDYNQQDVYLDNVKAALLLDEDSHEGVCIEFDRPQQIVVWTKIGNGWTANTFLGVRRPFYLERYEVLQRLFEVTPYALDKERIDALFAGKTRSKTAPAIRTELKKALAEALAATQDRASRGMIKGLERLGQRYLRCGGAVYEKWAADCVEELKHLTAELAAGRKIHHNFYDEAFLADRKQLLGRLPYQRDKQALAKVQERFAKPGRIDYPQAGGFGKLAVEAMCFDDLPALKRIGTMYRKFFLTGGDFAHLENSSSTIGNANWCNPLIWVNEAMAATEIFSEDQLAVTYEVIWFQARQVDDFGCGTWGNWGTMERTFLAYAAVIFPGARRRAQWVSKALECLDKTILSPCSPDGGWPEPPGYTHWAMLKGLELMELLGRTGALPDAASRDAALKRMMDYQWRLMTPDDQLPAIGDGWYVFRADIYNRFARRYQMKELAAACLRHGWKPEGDDLLFSGGFPDVGELAKAPAARASDLLSHDGYALFRTDGVQLTMFYGWQAGHGHFDTLSAMLYAHGRLFISEHVAGAKQLGCGYGSRWNELWSRASRSHCTVLVDDQTYSALEPGKCLDWQANGSVSHGVFSAPAYPDVTVTREVRQQGKRFDLVDTIQGGEKVGRHYTWRAFFPDDIELVREGQWLRAVAKEGSIRLDLTALDKDVEIILDSAPPKDFPATEEVTHRGKMLLLRRPIVAGEQATFRVGVEVL